MLTTSATLRPYGPYIRPVYILVVYIQNIAYFRAHWSKSRQHFRQISSRIVLVRAYLGWYPFQKTSRGVGTVKNRQVHPVGFCRYTRVSLLLGITRKGNVFDGGGGGGGARYIRNSTILCLKCASINAIFRSEIC